MFEINEFTRERSDMATLTEKEITLTREKMNKLREELQNRSKLDDFVLYTLNNFLHRYLESETTGKLSAEILDKSTLGLSHIKESNLVSVLKTQDQDLKKELIQMAKSFPKKDAPYVLYSLTCRYQDWSDSGFGKIQCLGQVDWGFPNFENSEMRKKKVVSVSFEEPIELRNKLPLALEEVCELF